MYEIGGLIIIGILAQWLAWRLRVPAILPLILAGLCVGPGWEYYTGHSLLSPRFDADAGTGLFPGNLLYSFVSLAIGLILFEGGLTLRTGEIKGLTNSILKLSTYGAFTTTVVAGFAAHFIIPLPWQIAFLFSTLIVVTGPTVIAPIMRQINVKRQISTILKWESIVIDPVGAFLAVLFYKFIIAFYEPDATVGEAIIQFVRSGLVGIGLGATLGYGLYLLITRLYVPKFLLNVFILAAVIGAFLMSDAIAHESGLLTTVVMGAFLANRDVPFLHDILDFKESLTILLISMLFILLSANITVEQIELVMDWRVLVLFLVVVFVARPLGVYWSLAGGELNWRDKAFISWVGPRGIVAAGVASLFGLELEERGVPGAEYITPLVFIIVLGTVLLNATLAGFVAKRLRVSLPKGSGIVIFGGGEGAREIATALKTSGRDVTIVTSNQSAAEAARESDLNVVESIVNTDDLDKVLDLTDVGYILAMTSSDEDNFYVVNNYRSREGLRGIHRLLTRKEVLNQRYSKRSLFSHFASYLILNRTARTNPGSHKYLIHDENLIDEALEAIREVKAIPIFLRCAVSGDITFVGADTNDMEAAVNDELFYIGPEVKLDGLVDTSESDAGGESKNVAEVVPEKAADHVVSEDSTGEKIS
ncbi:cation:proton antiporter [Neolewinella antarctica]|uniref:NhaP-type Na+/H+ or K+/H+ antiporter n=1 Tax=Neolewinella antarctica TaxID=442734 RepID=A0ABX0XCS0_9BACT|nr:sodium:proton antiporter [Neolewinella antarctica]NJC26582.1 NhaP-type Na+/H+ or K+/H+ antiporter [Neolewinella antarctica]